jgi:hypothetical protein
MDDDFFKLPVDKVPYRCFKPQYRNTFPRLYPTDRPEANYDRSLEVLKQVQQYIFFGRVTGGPAAT